MERRKHARSVISGLILAAVFVPRTVSAQDTPASRVLHVTVRDLRNRFVVGLEREQFRIVENGVDRQARAFSSVDSPQSIALVGLTASPVDIVRPGLTHADDEVIAANSVADAIRRLAASKNRRKVIITVDAESEDVPKGIQLMHADTAGLRKVITEARCTYLIEFTPTTTEPHVEVKVKPPDGLPVLTASWR